MAKKELTLSEFREIIKEEALKLKKRIVLENEKKALKAELKTLSESYNEEFEGEMEEGWIGDQLGTSEKSKREKLQKEFIKYANAWKKQGAIRGMTQDMLNSLMMQAAEDSYEGKPGLDKENKLMIYRPSDSIEWGGLGLNQSGSFGGTGNAR